MSTLRQVIKSTILETVHQWNGIGDKTEHLNPHKIPVLVVDQPLYDLESFSELLGEDKFVVMLCELHIGKAL